MIGGTNTAKIENRLIQISELFSEEFRELLKERVLEVFGQEIEKLLAKKIDKLKGEKGDKGDQGEAGKDGLDGVNGLDGKDGKDGLNGSDGKDGANGKDGIDGKNGLDGANGKDGLGGKDGLNGNDGLDGKDGLDAELDYEFIKKENAWLFEEWKSNLGDLTGKQGERGEKGKDGSEYPTKETVLVGSELTQVAAFELKQSNYKALIQITAIGSQGTFFDVESRILIQNLLGENKILSNTNGASLPVNPSNLNYSVKIENNLLKVFLSGKADEQIGVTVVLK